MLARQRLTGDRRGGRGKMNAQILRGEHGIQRQERHSVAGTSKGKTVQLYDDSGFAAVLTAVT